MVIQSSHLPLSQLNYGGGTFEYGTKMDGGGKRRRNRTNKKHRSTKRKMRRSKGKRTKQCKCKICKCNPCLCGKSISMKGRKNLKDFRAGLKRGRI